MTTYMAKPGEVERKWYVIDAAGKTLGHVATEAARLLRGKHKAIFTPHVDCGDHVIIINAEKVHLSGNKLQQKKYIRYSGYPGGLKVLNYAQLLQTFPERAVEKAVKGMIPHNRLGRQIAKKLKVYRGVHHPHAAQQPQNWAVRD
jgi:large subunit ribosomal protein L13